MLEAGAPGYGASSRSGGMIGHGHRLSYTKLIEKYGAEKAKALVARGDGVAAIPEGPDRRRSDRRRACSCAGACAARGRKRTTTRWRATQTRCGATSTCRSTCLSKADVRNEVATDLLPGRIAVPRAWRRASRRCCSRGCWRGRARPGALVAGHTPVTGAAARSEGIRRARRRAVASKPRKSWRPPTATRGARHRRSRAGSSRYRAFSSRPKTSGEARVRGADSRTAA